MKSLARMYEQSKEGVKLALQRTEIVQFVEAGKGPLHEDTLWAMTVLARSYEKAEQYTKSAEQWEEIVRSRKESNGPSCWITLDCVRCLAEMEIKCQRNAEAETLLLDAIKQAPSENGWLFGSLKESLAAVRSKLARSEGNADDSQQ